MSSAASKPPFRDIPATAPQELASILQSAPFEKAPTLKKLLAYLWECRDRDVSEYAIATEALGRKKDFDPRTDASVRVQVARLRQRLKEFYDSPEGLQLTTRLIVPLGCHRIQVAEPDVQQPTDFTVESDQPTLVEAEVGDRSRSGFFLRWPYVVLIAVVTILALSNFWTLTKLKQLQAQQSHRRQGELPLFWCQFLGDAKSTRIVLSNPVFFGWPNGLMARDFSVNSFSDLNHSPALQAMVSRFGEPQLSQYYFSSSDVFGSLQLKSLLDPAGKPVIISSTIDSPQDSLDRDNLIILGTANTLAPFQNFTRQLSLQLDIDHQQVIDLRPDAGKPSRYRPVFEATSRLITPGIVAVLPGTAPGSHVLIAMSSVHTSALMSYLTSDNGIRELEAAMASHGHCSYFEAVVFSEINGSTSLKSRLAEFKPIKN